MMREPPVPLWRRVLDVVLNAGRTSAVDEALVERMRAEAPMIWLLGKVQSGKTSIVRAVTGDAEAEIGAGFRPCTRHSRVYDFPPDLPVVRFLDTRGLGEVDHDPAEDLAMLEGRAHAVVAVVRAMDPARQELLAVLRQVRRRHSDWAVLLVQTRLHDGYPDERDHPPPEQLRRGSELDGLRRALAVQERAFRDLPGSGARSGRRVVRAGSCSAACPAACRESADCRESVDRSGSASGSRPVIMRRAHRTRRDPAVLPIEEPDP